MNQLSDTQFLMSDDVTQEALGSISSDTREIKRIVKGMGADAIAKSAQELSAAVAAIKPETITSLTDAATKVTEASAALNSSVESSPSSAGMTPIPFVTDAIILMMLGLISSKFGPIFPYEFASFRV